MARVSQQLWFAIAALIAATVGCLTLFLITGFETGFLWMFLFPNRWFILLVPLICAIVAYALASPKVLRPIPTPNANDHDSWNSGWVARGMGVTVGTFILYLLVHVTVFTLLKFGAASDLLIAIPAFLFFGAIFVLAPALLVGGLSGYLYSRSHAP
jgi:hypothetical protein